MIELVLERGALYMILMDIAFTDNASCEIFEKMYVSYAKLLFYIANDILKDEMTAEDAVHDAFVRIAKNIDKFKGFDEVRQKRLACIIVRNLSIDIYRKRQREFIEDAAIISDLFDLQTWDMTNQVDISGHIEEAIGTLSGVLRDTMYLYCFEEYKPGEIAELLNIPVETVRKRIQRARKLVIERVGHLRNEE